MSAFRHKLYKATAKAMSSAYKHAMLQLFCVPVAQIDDADASGHRLKARQHQPAPVEGWEQWAAGIADIAASCATTEALQRLQDRQRPLLQGLSRERPDLYDRICTDRIGDGDILLVNVALRVSFDLVRFGRSFVDCLLSRFGSRRFMLGPSVPRAIFRLWPSTPFFALGGG